METGRPNTRRDVAAETDLDDSRTGTEHGTRQRYETTDELFQLVKPIMDKAQMSDQDKAFVLNSLRTSEQVPEITSEEQYELYSKLERELSVQLPERDDPTYGKAFLTFTRSPAGVLANGYAARMIEWENKERGEHWVP